MRVTSRQVIYYQGRAYMREVCQHPSVMGIFSRRVCAVIMTGARKDMWFLRPRLHTITP